MISREEVKKLLAKKSLTGHEAGRLWMEDSFLVVRGQKGLLTEKERRYMKSLVRSQEAIAIYNSYLDLYSMTEIALKEADIMALLAQSALLDLALAIKEYLDKEVSSWTRPPELLIPERVSLDIILSIKLPDIKKWLKIFMAYRVRIENLSRETGVDFGHDIRNDIRAIKYGLETYNFYAGAPRVKAEKISLEKQRPDRQTLDNLYNLINIISPIQQKSRDQEASDGQEA